MLIRDTLERSARHRAVERRLFELVGAWAPASGDPAMTRVLAAQARHHAWRASMWDELVPVLHDVPAPEGDDAALLAPLEAPTPAALVAVLDEVIDRYEADLAAVTEISDAPMARTLQLVLLDARADRDGLRSLLGR